MSEKIKETIGAGDVMEATVVKGQLVVNAIEGKEPHPVTHPKTKFSEGEEVLLKDGREAKVMLASAEGKYRVSTHSIVDLVEEDLTKK